MQQSVVTFAIRRGGMYTSGVPRAEDPVLRSWVAHAEEEQARARDHLTEQGFTATHSAIQVRKMTQVISGSLMRIHTQARIVSTGVTG